MYTIDAILSHPDLKEHENMNREYIKNFYEKSKGGNDPFCVFFMTQKNNSGSVNTVIDAQWFSKEGEPIDRKTALEWYSGKHTNT